MTPPERGSWVRVSAWFSALVALVAKLPAGMLTAAALTVTACAAYVLLLVRGVNGARPLAPAHGAVVALFLLPYGS